VAALFVAAMGCGAGRAGRSSEDTALTRLCDLTLLRLHGSFQGALGSQFGGVTISSRGERSCQLRGGRPKVFVSVGGEPIVLPQTNDATISASDGPRVVVVPIAAKEGGPGFVFEWSGTCLPRGPISVRVRFPGTEARLPVLHEDHIVGPRCDVKGSKGSVAVSVLGPDLGTLAI
jgi:hypothetical protein